MRIIVDAMGGDFAPDAPALGAIRAAKELNISVVLVGRGEQILACLKRHGVETLPKCTWATHDHCHPNDYGAPFMGEVYARRIGGILESRRNRAATNGAK